MSDRKDLHQEELIIGFGLRFKYRNQIINIEITRNKDQQQLGAMELQQSLVQLAKELIFTG
ncbi:unnamed protein product [Paramecium primaurelia]|uniref:Uncharacterized protein n=1 Tax=Paramecium primaurelia TaxID=5886 RepID=A0A8S1LZ34_PARPR|nr:unnamed protein product [Paramecium primaurelia]